MMLSINSVDHISKKKFKKRIKKFLDVNKSFSVSQDKIIYVNKLDMNIIFYDSAISFSIHKKNSNQEKLIKNCIKMVFKKNDIIYYCDEECPWIKELENTNEININYN